MRMRIRHQGSVLTLCLSLMTAAAFAGNGPAAPPAPPAPAAAPMPGGPAGPPPFDPGATPATPATPAAPAAPRPPSIDDAALQARLDAARRRMEVAAQQLAAVSAQMARRAMQQRFQLLAGPPHALIGVQLGRSSGEPGARVREVSPGGPAERAGLRAGDLIVAVNGTSVHGPQPARRVVELLGDVRPGEKVNLRVLRDGKTRDFTVTARQDADLIFAGMPVRPPDVPVPPPFKGLSAWAGAPEILGGPVADMELVRLTPGLGSYFGTSTGVLVVRAPPDGALGLRDGDVILSIGGRKPIDSSHVIRILGSYDPGEKITLEVLRQHRRISVATTMPAQPGRTRHGGRGGIASTMRACCAPTSPMTCRPS